ncbi:pyrroline-5-carboxylate reductase [Acidihalobacter prosperus]
MNQTPEETITFIGGGNMASSLIGGLIQDGYPANRIRVADPDEKQRVNLATQFPGIAVFEDNAKAAQEAGCIVLAVKPQLMAQALQPLTQIAGNPLFISIAAGISCKWLTHYLGDSRAIVRAMPNTPSLIGLGATGAYGNSNVNAKQRDMADRILRAVGELQWFEEESALNTVTALSGSGPAYVFLLIEAMEAAAVSLGLPADAARALTLHTVHGASRLALESQDTPATLRQRVTSPGGTTEKALQIMESGGLRELIADAMGAASHRARELGEKET